MIESNKWPLRLGALALMAAASLGQAGGFEDPLDVAAQKNVLAAKSPLIGVARARGARWWERESGAIRWPGQRTRRRCSCP